MLTEKGWPSLRLLSTAGFEYVHFTGSLVLKSLITALEVRQLLEANKSLTSLVLYECYNVSLEDIADLQALFPSVSFYHGQKYPIK